ncbi:Transcriptional regulator, effector-binding domain/component [Devosia sp. LC5]|uniref:GyrI-like domain-containing protein n=1 Tax=Devosia sp. LC5 TaxID=1502724 RepID=UPI0004E3AE60|nr:GyrI-like domain-containing protein [Devosia sp. LC5]KFC72562.1 Transcriptional regulator, effector-binding domain/component [Devosia sp. LC5]
MLTLPEIIDRPAQPYAFIRFTVRMDQMKQPADEGFSALFAWLGQRGIQPIAAPFYNYRRINMSETLDVEAGVPIAELVDGEGQIETGTLPAGKFVTLDWVGHYDGLMGATAMLIGWVRLTQVELDMTTKGQDDFFACRLEIYETDPSEEPDAEKWRTQLAFKVKG